MTKAMFLPGAGGRRSFWEPVAGRLGPEIEPVLLAWPGFGDEPRDDSIACLTDLVDYVVARMDGPCDVIAQSMGGVVAMSLALRHPERVRRMVLTGTSGGIDVFRFGAEDWRSQPIGSGSEQTPAWFIEDDTDLTDDIPVIATPTLLIWGDGDHISPPAAGEYLASLMPHARFEVVPGGHDHPALHPEASARLIEAFLLDPTPSLSRPG